MCCIYNINRKTLRAARISSHSHGKKFWEDGSKLTEAIERVVGEGKEGGRDLNLTAAPPIHVVDCEL
jgi:hypothetical protein